MDYFSLKGIQGCAGIHWTKGWKKDCGRCDLGCLVAYPAKVRVDSHPLLKKVVRDGVVKGENYLENVRKVPRVKQLMNGFDLLASLLKFTTFDEAGLILLNNLSILKRVPLFSYINNHPIEILYEIPQKYIEHYRMQVIIYNKCGQVFSLWWL